MLRLGQKYDGIRALKERVDSNTMKLAVFIGNRGVNSETLLRSD